jgi:hypothetical protein
VVLGDSFAWGYGVGDDEVFTEVLASLLPTVEVVNLGVTAYGTQQELDYLRQEGVRYSPDIVLLSFVLNDVLESPDRFRALVPPPAQSTGVKAFLARNSHLYRFVIDRINTNKRLVRFLVAAGVKEQLAGFDELDINLSPALKVYPDSLQRAFERVEAELLALHDFTRRGGIRLIVVLVPSLQSVDRRAFLHSIAYTIFAEEDFDLERPYRLLADFCRRHGIELIDCQQHTGHLASFGAREIPRAAFERHLSVALAETPPRRWTYDRAMWSQLGLQPRGTPQVATAP